MDNKVEKVVKTKSITEFRANMGHILNTMKQDDELILIKNSKIIGTFIKAGE